MIAVRRATLALVDSLDESTMSNVGLANNNSVSARAICWIMAGHTQHHLDILRERYGVASQRASERDRWLGHLALLRARPGRRQPRGALAHRFDLGARVGDREVLAARPQLEQVAVVRAVGIA